jgi:hypothetical protein
MLPPRPLRRGQCLLVISHLPGRPRANCPHALPGPLLLISAVWLGACADAAMNPAGTAGGTGAAGTGAAGTGARQGGAPGERGGAAGGPAPRRRRGRRRGGGRRAQAGAQARRRRRVGRRQAQQAARRGFAARGAAGRRRGKASAPAFGAQMNELGTRRLRHRYGTTRARLDPAANAFFTRTVGQQRHNKSAGDSSVTMGAAERPASGSGRGLNGLGLARTASSRRLLRPARVMEYDP